MTFLAALIATALAQPPPSVEEHLESHEVYAFSDGSSVFAFHKNHSFRLEPIGMSGRTVEGVWSRVDGGLLVTGKWTWINGLSVDGDFREMVIQVTPHPGEPTKVGMREVEVQPAYVTIEKLNKVDGAVYKRRQSAVAP